MDSKDIKFITARAPRSAGKKRTKPHITLPWTNESTHELIQAVKNHTCIWEYSCPEYKDREQREQAWQSIAVKFPEQGLEGCKAKWANVKTAFLNVKKKMISKCDQGAESIQPQWPFWTAMQFCFQHEWLKRPSSVSAFEQFLDESPPTTFASAKKPKTAEVADRISPDVVMQRALQFLDADVDKWHGVGMYLALQMRDLAKTNLKAANKLHAELVKKAVEAMLEEADKN